MNRKYQLLLVLIFISLLLFSQSTVRLKKTFVNEFKDKITIASEYNVWFTHHTPHSAADDADIHVAGYDDIVGMPTVAEMMNARDEQGGIDLFIQHEGEGNVNNPRLDVEGVWRLWPEHMGPSGTTFFQGMTLSHATIKLKKTNPDHVFEIHPVTRVGTLDVTHTIKNIEGYEPKDARDAFNVIRNKQFSISSTNITISFTTKSVGQNYIDMWIRIDSLWEVDDGAFAFCTVLDSDFDPDNDNIADKKVSSKTRVAFVKNSESFNDVIQKNPGDFMHILGTPRISLAILSWREWVSDDRPEVLTWRMPFEIIAAGNIE